MAGWDAWDTDASTRPGQATWDEATQADNAGTRRVPACPCASTCRVRVVNHMSAGGWVCWGVASHKNKLFCKGIQTFK